MAFVRLEFACGDDNGYALVGAGVQTDKHVTPPSPDVKVVLVSGGTFLYKYYYRGEPIAIKTKQGEVLQADIEEILINFVNDENETLYLIFDRYDGYNNLRAVWVDFYDEEEAYRRYRVLDVCTIYKFEMMLAADESLPIKAQSIIDKSRFQAVRSRDILELYESIDDDNADDESEYGESEPVPPSFCPHPGMCFNYEYDRDMCDKCGGF